MLYVAYTNKFTFILDNCTIIGGTNIVPNKLAKVISITEMASIWKNNMKYNI